MRHATNILQTADSLWRPVLNGRLCKMDMAKVHFMIRPEGTEPASV